MEAALMGLRRLRTEVTINSHFAILTSVMEPIREQIFEESQEDVNKSDHQ
jgi:hypothetical protein